MPESGETATEARVFNLHHISFLSGVEGLVQELRCSCADKIQLLSFVLLTDLEGLSLVY